MNGMAWKTVSVFLWREGLLLLRAAPFFSKQENALLLAANDNEWAQRSLQGLFL
jgi:hypothetical protein